MKHLKYSAILLLLLNISTAFAQNFPETTNSKSPIHKLTIEPAIGLNLWPTSDLLITNVAQWNVKKRVSIISYTSYTYNSVFLRNFNHVKTNYNYSLSQKFGVGTSLYAKHSTHTFSLLAGIKYNAFKETLNNPEFEKVTASVKSTSPDFGLMYNLKVGNKKYFFSYRMYLPLYPYPFKTLDAGSIDGNLANLSMEFGVGVRLK